MEPRFSHDFSQVRIHTDTRAAESAQAVNALAYTIGSDIVFDTAQYAPDSYTGKQLLAHELTHVIQQSLGAATGPPPLATSKLEVTANQAASAVMEGTTVQVTDASAPGLARQQRWLSKNPNPQSLSDQALQRELQLIRQWLLDHPMSSPETQRLGEVLAIFEQEAASRPTRSSRRSHSTH